MVLNGYCQKDCINGLTKEEAQSVKDIPLIEESIDGINSHIGNMSSDIEDLQVASIRYADHFDTLDGKVSTLETGLSDLDDWVTEINNTTIANLSTQVNTLENSTIPGINARLLTIEDTEIPDINDAIDDLDDRVSEIELGNNFNFVSETADWSQYDDSNRIIMIRNADQKSQFIIPRGQSLDFMLKTIHPVTSVNTANHYCELMTRAITQVTPATTIVFRTSNIVVRITDSGTVSYTTNTTSGINKLSLSDWNDVLPGCVMYSDKPTN